MSWNLHYGLSVVDSIDYNQQTSLTHLASAFSDSTPDIATRAAAVAGGSNGAGEPRITLDELSDLYRRADSDRDPAVDAAIPPGEDDLLALEVIKLPLFRSSILQ